MSAQSLTNADDARLVDLIKGAHRRATLIAPGVSVEVADALSAAWDRLGAEAVQVVLDVDSEICRIGYGTIEGLKVVHAKAQALGTAIGHQPGVRIGVLLVDDKILVFSPTPLLIEAGTTIPTRPNAILLSDPPPEVAGDLGLLPATGSGEIGRQPLDELKLKRVERDLEIAPPQPFDLARQVRVFTTRFQFVELKMTGCLISRRKVRIPNELVGLARAAGIESRFHAQFDLVEDKDLAVEHEGRKITERSLQEHRRQIERDFLIVLPEYGTVVLRQNKQELERQVERLRRDVAIYSEGVVAALAEQMEASRSAVVSALLPAVKENPPQRWRKLHGAEMTQEAVERALDDDLAGAFGRAHDLVREMRVDVVFKDLAYESLTDAKFRDVVRKAMPGVEELHQEFDAISARRTES